MHHKPKTARGFPVGSVYEADFGKLILDLHFDSERTLAYTVEKGPSRGTSQRVTVSITRIRPGVFAVSWQEKDKTSVVQLDDFEKGISYAYITGPDGKTARMKGTLKRMELPVLCA